MSLHQEEGSWRGSCDTFVYFLATGEKATWLWLPTGPSLTLIFKSICVHLVWLKTCCFLIQMWITWWEYQGVEKYPKCDWAIRFGFLGWSKNVLPGGLHVSAPPSCLKNSLDENKTPKKNKGKQVVCRKHFGVMSARDSADPGSDWFTSKESSLGRIQSWVKLHECWKCSKNLKNREREKGSISRHTRTSEGIRFCWNITYMNYIYESVPISM